MHRLDTIRGFTHKRWREFVFLFCLFAEAAFSLGYAQTGSFHDAPADAQKFKNPYEGQAEAVVAGKQLCARNCGVCHGIGGKGTGNVPPLANGKAQAASAGAVFWYITRGDVDNGMPSWAGMSEQQRWQVISYIQSLTGAEAEGARTDVPVAQPTGTRSTAPPPKAPFTDYRYEKPGTSRHIRVEDLPAPFASESATNGPKIVARPENAKLQVPEGFKVELFATGLNNPRLMRVAPNGDVFLAETSAGNVKVFRGMTADGKPQQMQVFASGLNIPFGIAFYPLGPNPQWVYVANMDSVVRFPYHNGDLHASGPPQQLADLASGGHHRSRDIQ